MPVLPPLPDNNSFTAWLGYTSVGHEHEMQFRMKPAVTPSAAATVATLLAQALKGLLPPSDHFFKFRYRLSGSDFSFPYAFDPVVGTNNFTPDPQHAANYMAWVGRSPSGRRTRLTFFTTLSNGDDNFRYTATEYPIVATILDILEDPANGICAKDEQSVVWNQYANTGQSAYWRNQLRGG